MREESRHTSDLAVALHYDGSGAPRVTAKGRGAVAAEILRRAQEHGIPIRDDPELVQLLAQVELDQAVPEILYRAVAEVIAFAYLIQGKRPAAGGSRKPGDQG